MNEQVSLSSSKGDQSFDLTALLTRNFWKTFMCGRYYIRSHKQRIAEAFRIGNLPADFELPPDFNIAPSTLQPVNRADADTGERTLALMRCG